ncbi:hypothetical protein Q1695_005926 [Nippostrongylus brasiliensis]|nr:hypothetical protein Q1695_005926 [Nippostrongylus brasiliensis]
MVNYRWQRSMGLISKISRCQHCFGQAVDLQSLENRSALAVLCSSPTTFLALTRTHFYTSSSNGQFLLIIVAISYRNNTDRQPRCP